ncbi:hypothetical protein J6590_017683 [Homalodisca vitripennis]|nr:hypothetical protein J6590_017683 [Homalodisca vitripennis]
MRSRHPMPRVPQHLGTALLDIMYKSMRCPFKTKLFSKRNLETLQFPSNDQTLEEFALVDEGIAVSEVLFDSDIVESLNGEEGADKDGHESDKETADITTKEERIAITNAEDLPRKTSIVPDSVFLAVVALEK